MRWNCRSRSARSLSCPTHSIETGKSGCAGIVIAEPAAGLLSNDDCLQFSSRYVKRIIESVQDEQFMVVLHNYGKQGLLYAMIQTGAAAYHFGNAVNIDEALAQCPADALVMGNIDPVAVLRVDVAPRKG